MTTALVYVPQANGTGPLVADLQAAGFEVPAVVAAPGQLPAQALLHAPHVVVCQDPNPGDALLQALQTLGATAARPVLLLTTDAAPAMVERAMASGVHAYVVNGYAAPGLTALVHIAQARFGHEQKLHAALADVSSRLDERKAVERAKGILMQARQLSDDDAFEILRTASMHSNQRLGQVSEHIIQSAHNAQSVNRAGQLRMLSQRLIKLVLLQVAGIHAAQQKKSVAQAVRHIDDNLALLGKSLSQPTFGDLLGQTEATWAELKKALRAKDLTTELHAIDALAETLLLNAEQLTTSLQTAGGATPLQVLNVAGRQRMLSQRFAKFALQGNASGMAQARAAIEQGLAYLHSIHLSTPDIRAALARAALGWQQLLDGAGQAQQPSGQERLASASEELLLVFEQLSTHYEHSMQMLVG